MMEHETGECKSCEKLVDKVAALEQKLKDEASFLAKAQAESLDRAMNDYKKIAALEMERDSWKEKFEIANNAYEEKVNEIEDLDHDMGEVFKWLKDENTRLKARLEPIDEFMTSEPLPPAQHIYDAFERSRKLRDGSADPLMNDRV